MKTKQALLVEPRRFEWRDVEVSPGDGEILIRVLACGLCNWELNHWAGHLGSYPQTLGHEIVGQVVEVGRGVTGISIGQTITGLPDGLYGFADYCVMSAERCEVVTGPHPELALGEPLSCVITTLSGAAPLAGDVVAVMGCGPMGLWCIQALSGSMLGELLAIDVDDARLAMAQSYGATRTINASMVDGPAQLSTWTDGHMADVLIEGTGRPATLNDASAYLGSQRPRLVVMSSHEQATTQLDLRPLMQRGAEVHFTHPQYGQPDCLRRAVCLYNRGVFNVHDLITHRFTLDQINTAFQTLEHKPAGYIKGIVTTS